MANPYAITPANPLQALLMGQKGYETGKKTMQDSALAEAGRLYAAGDLAGAKAMAAQGGSLATLMGFANQANNERDFKFRQTEAQRAQQNADRGFGLQERQIGATAGNAAAMRDLQRQQFEFQKEQGNRPEIRDVNGVPMLVDRKSNQMVPIGGTPPPPPGIPPGVDPTVYRREQAQAAVKSQTADRDLQDGGKSVMAMIDKLEAKIINPADPNVARKFSAAAGPFVGPASDASAWDPRKWMYEAGRTRESKAYLDQIKQDAQAINATMQRALLKGQGSASNEERAAISQILGKIIEARSPEDAQALMGNFRGIVRNMFKMQDDGGGQPGKIPPPPAGFVVQ